MNKGGPVLSGGNVRYELAGKTKAISHGGIGGIQRLVNKTGLAKHIDDNLHLVKIKQWFSILQRKRFTAPTSRAFATWNGGQGPSFASGTRRHPFR